MSRGINRENQTRIDDLENAMKAIGRILADSTSTPKQRIAKANGVLSLYECEAPKPVAAPALSLEGGAQT